MIHLMLTKMVGKPNRIFRKHIKIEEESFIIENENVILKFSNKKI